MKLINRKNAAFLALTLVLVSPGCGNKADNESNEKSVAGPTLSDHLTDYQVELDHKVYQLPADYSTFEKDGWKTKENLSLHNIA